MQERRAYQEMIVSLDAGEVEALDAWRRTQPGSPNRGEALRRLALQALADVGGRETIALDDLNASNDE